MNGTVEALIKSWAAVDSPVTPTAEILEWIQERDRETLVDIRKVSLPELGDWFYSQEEGVLRNQKGSFFKVAGLRCGGVEQPMILQPENGYLGIICREIDGVLHFLMQAKIEPGNLNKIQISPTLQATKSNFTQAHGGKRPAYLDYFLHADRYQIILDQLQSEQSSRFLRKRNRNMLIRVEEEVPLLPSHRWMTLGQIKELACNFDDLVNMDTRTVLSGIPFAGMGAPPVPDLFRDKPLYRSIFEGDGSWSLPEIYHYINDYKMFRQQETELLPLHRLKGWRMTPEGIFPEKDGGFQVIYCQIEIEGREVRRWSQPLFEATGISTFGLVLCDIDGITHFLVQALPEPGCFDGIELGPSIQLDAAAAKREKNRIEGLLDRPEAEILCDVLLSEEGGRFYHEHNRNVLLRVSREQLGDLPEGYFLLDHRTLNGLCQINNCLNIQLRDLISLLRISR